MHADRPPATDRHPDLTKHAPPVGGTGGSSGRYDRRTSPERPPRDWGSPPAFSANARDGHNADGSALEQHVLSDTHPPPTERARARASADAFPSSAASVWRTSSEAGGVHPVAQGGVRRWGAGRVQLAALAFCCCFCCCCCCWPWLGADAP